jgi:hypothetical protein
MRVRCWAGSWLPTAQQSLADTQVTAESASPDTAAVLPAFWSRRKAKASPGMTIAPTTHKAKATVPTPLHPFTPSLYRRRCGLARGALPVVGAAEIRNRLACEVAAAQASIRECTPSWILGQFEVDPAPARTRRARSKAPNTQSTIPKTSAPLDAKMIPSSTSAVAHATAHHHQPVRPLTRIGSA